MVEAYVASVISFVVALLVGGLAIYVSARFVADIDDYGHAVITALLGALGWTLISRLGAFLAGYDYPAELGVLGEVLTLSIPLIAPLIALVVWVGIINWRYPGDWVKAAIIGIVAWASATVIIFILDEVFSLGVGAFGVPGV